MYHGQRLDYIPTIEDGNPSIEVDIRITRNPNEARMTMKHALPMPMTDIKSQDILMTCLLNHQAANLWVSLVPESQFTFW